MTLENKLIEKMNRDINIPKITTVEIYYCLLNGLIGLSFGLPLSEMDTEQGEHFLLDGIAFNRL